MIIATSFPTTRNPFLLSLVLGPSNELPRPEQFGFTAYFITGSFLVYVGTFIRSKCYEYLGRHFTFELSLRKEHKLITSGPYSIVRHPGYTGSLSVYTGILITQLGSGSWWAECGLWSMVSFRVFGVLWVSWCVVSMVALLGRIPKEDYVLRGEFSDQWDAWARKTPYRLIPFVY